MDALRAAAADALTQRFAPASGPDVQEVHVRTVVRMATVRWSDGRVGRRAEVFRIYSVRVDGAEVFQHYGERGNYQPRTPTK